MIEINLLPASAGKTKRRSGGGGGQTTDLRAQLAAFTSKIRDPYLAAGVGGVVIGAAVVGLLFMTQQKRATELAAAEVEAVADSTRFATFIKQRTRALATRDSVMRQINVIRAIDGDRYVWPHLMDEVSNAVPEYTWLTALTITGTPQGSQTASIIGVDSAAAGPAAAKKPGADSATTITPDVVTVSIEGQTVDIEAITRFMRQLEASPFVRDVQLGKSILTLQEGAEVTTFLLEAKFDRPDSTSGVIRRVPLTASVVPIEGN